MKKLIAVLALSAVACAAAFADISVSDWNASYPASGLTITDYAPAGFDAYLSETSSKVVFGFHSSNVSDWLYNKNEPVILTVENFGENDFSATDGVISISIADANWRNTVIYTLPWAGNGTYTFAPQNIKESSCMGSLEGLEVNAVDMFVRSDDTLLRLNPGGAGRITLALGEPEEDPTHETELPEPMSAAYAVMGLGSLIGMKKRFVK